MTLREAIERTVREGNAAGAARIADHLRAKGLNYSEVHDFVNRIQPIELAEWDALLYEADTAA